MKRLLALAFLLSGCGSSDSVAQDPGTTISQSGGSLRSGDLEVEFAAGSVSEPIRVTDETVTLSTIPGHLKPLSAVHKIELSSPQAYKPRTARVKFTLPTPHEGASVYHSDDGVHWHNLGQDREARNVSAKTHKFSYFFAGAIANGAYTANVWNQSQNFGTVVLYRSTPQPFTVPLVMQAQTVAPNQRVQFQWTDTYGFFWSFVPVLEPGVVVGPSQVLTGSLPGQNLVQFSGNVLFGLMAGAPNQLQISQLPTVQPGGQSVGITVSECPAWATQTQPGLLSSFPLSGEYRLAFTPFAQPGQVVDPFQMAGVALNFASGQTTLNPLYTPDQVWVFPSAP